MFIGMVQVSNHNAGFFSVLFFLSVAAHVILRGKVIALEKIVNLHFILAYILMQEEAMQFIKNNDFCTCL